MRLFFLADGASIHTNRWVNALLNKGHIIHLFSLNSFNRRDYGGSKEIFSYTIININKKKNIVGGINKTSYLKVLPRVKKAIQEFRPDILHAHFASSYGLLGALSGFHPFIISVWGYDVFRFPSRSIVHRKILQYNLKKADKLLSTSQTMARQTNKFTNKNIIVTPFGIDLNVFKEDKSFKKETLSPFKENDVVIGSTKPLMEIYGHKYLVKAFSIVAKKHPELKLKLCFVGGGDKKAYLELLCEKLNIRESVYFVGKVKHDKIPAYLNIFDIYAALSLEESFGVAVLEAGACSKPVLVSDAGGLPEVVDEGKTGYVVPARDVQASARALEKLILNFKINTKMGQAARQRIKKIYNWDENVEQMNQIYLSMKRDK